MEQYELKVIRGFRFAQMIFKCSDERIEIDWIKRFPNDSTIIKPIQIKDIIMLVADDSFLKKIITKDKIIDINSCQPLNHDFAIYLDRLIKIVIENNGQLVTSRYYTFHYGKNFLLILSIAVSACLIPRLWDFFDYYSLLLLLFPLIIIIRKIKTGANIT